LPPDYNVSELQRKHGALASVIVTKEGLEKRLVAKEVTIFDADERDSNEPQMDIRVNGFEFDTSRDLSGAVQAFQEQLHGSPEEEARQETYDFSTERWRIEKCGLLTQEDLDAWVQAAKKHSEGKLSPTELPCREKWALDYTYEVSQTSRFVSFGQKCRGQVLSWSAMRRSSQIIFPARNLNCQSRWSSDRSHGQQNRS